LTVCFHFRKVVPTVPPLAPAKVLRADASVPTRRRTSRAPRAGASTAATASESSQGAAEASRPQLVVSPAEPQPAVAEGREAPVVVEAQRAMAMDEARTEAEVQPAAPVAVALPAASAVEGHPAPAAAETRLEAAVVTPQQEPVVMEARPEVVVEVRPGPALDGSSQAMAVEIPDDDAPPPRWDQWVNLPMPSPEPQVGALVRRWDGHMVAGGRGHGAEASSSRAGPSVPGEGRVDEPPAFADAQEEQQLRRELRDHGAALNRALNEALRIHGGPAWRVFQVRRHCLFSSIFVVFVLVPRGAMLTDFDLLAAGARAPRPRQVWRLRPDEC
jgi:hypothetical protein